VFGFDMDRLDALWRDYVTEQYQQAGGKQVHQAPTGVLLALTQDFLPVRV
jgi:hypothetical protein